jgi:ribosomal protein S2
MCSINSEEDVKLMLTAGVHIGSKFCDPNMERYTFKRKHDGELTRLLPPL